MCPRKPPARTARIPRGSVECETAESVGSEIKTSRSIDGQLQMGCKYKVVTFPRSILCGPPAKLRHSDLVGFSLIETVLAVGVVAFALVALLALLPAGLANFRTAIDTSVASQIFQQVVTDVEQADLDTLLARAETRTAAFYVLPTRYFDEQGNEVIAGGDGGLTTAESHRVIYHVRVRGSVPGGPFTSLPASPEQPRFSPRDTTFLAIQIANNPGHREVPVDPHLLWKTRDVPVVSYTAVVTRNSYPRNTAPAP